MVVLAQWIKHLTLAGACPRSNPRHRQVFPDFVCLEFNRFFKMGFRIGAMASTSLHDELLFRPVSKHPNIETLMSQLLISETFFF